MATEINRAPVLKGKAAMEFWKKVDKFTAKESKSDIEEGLRKYRDFMSKQKHLQPSMFDLQNECDFFPLSVTDLFIDFDCGNKKILK